MPNAATWFSASWAVRLTRMRSWSLMSSRGRANVGRWPPQGGDGGGLEAAHRARDQFGAAAQEFHLRQRLKLLWQVGWCVDQDRF